MRPRLFTQPDGLTRRGLLQAGGLAGAAAFVGGRPWSPESAAAAAPADDGTPAHLLRSSYVSIKDPSFVVGNATQLQLVAVSDLPAASVVSELAGSEDAFALTLYGPAGLEQGTHAFSNSDLGAFDFFIAADGAAGTSYTVVVNRSVGAAKHFPKPPKQGDDRPGANEHPVEGPERLRRAERKRFVRRMHARRTAKGLACSVDLAPGLDADSVVVWLTRGKRTVATATGSVKKHRAVVRARTRRRLRPGRYVLSVIAFDRHGSQHGRTERVTLH
jgi:hypothetical protein